MSEAELAIRTALFLAAFFGITGYVTWRAEVHEQVWRAAWSRTYVGGVSGRSYSKPKALRRHDVLRAVVVYSLDAALSFLAVAVLLAVVTAGATS